MDFDTWYVLMAGIVTVWGSLMALAMVFVYAAASQRDRTLAPAKAARRDPELDR